MNLNGAEFRDRCLAELVKFAVAKFNAGDLVHGNDPNAPAGIFSEDCLTEIEGELVDAFFYVKGEQFKRIARRERDRKVMALLHEALGDSHNWRAHVLDAVAAMDAGKE